MMEVPYHYQFRIIVIGDTMVGKSSLLKTFSEGTFGEMEPTVGVDFFSKIIEIKPKYCNVTHNSHYNNRANTSLAANCFNDNNDHNNRLDENIIVKLQIWDTAGQERFKSIVTSYYRNSVGIVLVYDVTNRESYDHLIDWFTEARRHVEPSPSPTLSPITQNPPSKFVYPMTSTPTKSNNHRYNNTNNNSNFNISKNIYDNHNSNHHSYSNNNVSESSSSANNITYNPLSDSHYNNSNNDKQESYKMAYLVLGCKTDLTSQRQVSYEDGQAFADLYGFRFIETSSKTNYNVNQAFQLLAEEIYDKISECGRLNKLHRTASGGHLTFDATSSQINEGIRLGPLIENNSRRNGVAYGGNRVRLLEAQPVSGFLGGCC